MDGINGLAASQAALVALALAGFGGAVWSWLALALLAACAGFLPFNFPRARIFMSSGRVLRNTPRGALPTGVRVAATM